MVQQIIDPSAFLLLINPFLYSIYLTILTLFCYDSNFNIQSGWILCFKISLMSQIVFKNLKNLKNEALKHLINLESPHQIPQMRTTKVILSNSRTFLTWPVIIFQSSIQIDLFIQKNKFSKIWTRKEIRENFIHKRDYFLFLVLV